MVQDKEKLFRTFVVILLLINTFFIGSMWYTMQTCGGSGKGIFCPWSKSSGKICPLTGKFLGKGSATEKGSGY